MTGGTPNSAPRLLSGFWRGAVSPVKGLGILLRRPSLFLWTVIPLAIAFALDSALLAALAPALREAVDTRIPDEGWYWVAAGWAADAVLMIAFVVSAVLIFAVIYFAVAGPFNEMLSERIERIRGNAVMHENGLSILKALLDGIRQALVLALLGLPAFAVSLLPLVGPLIFGGWTAILLGFSFFEIPLSRRGVPFSEKRSLARRHFGEILGLGTAVFVLSIVPFLPLVLMPSFVAGGTILCGEATGGRAP